MNTGSNEYQYPVTSIGAEEGCSMIGRQATGAWLATVGHEPLDWKRSMVIMKAVLGMLQPQTLFERSVANCDAQASILAQHG